MADLKTRTVINKKLGKFQKRLECVYGIMGDGNGNVKGSREPYALVRQPDNAVIEIYNKRVQFKDGLPVLCGYDPLEPFLFQVLSIWTTALNDPSALSPTNVLPKHSERQGYYGDDPLFIEKRAYLPARVGVASVGGLSVDVYQDAIYINGHWTALAAQTIDLSSYLPTASGASTIVLLTYAIDGSITKTAHTGLVYNSELITDIPAIPSGEIGLAAVRLYTGQTVIRDGYVNRDITDCRTWLAPVGGSGATAFTGLTDTFASYTGLAGEYLKVKATEDGLETGTPAGGSGTPATTVTDETNYGVSPAVGTSTNYAREDHTHGTPATPAPGSGHAVWSPRAYPASAHAKDDEFPTGSLNGKWATFDPGSAITSLAVTAQGLKIIPTKTNFYYTAGIYQNVPAGDFTVWTRVHTIGKQAGDLKVGILFGEDLVGNPTTCQLITCSYSLGAWGYGNQVEAHWNYSSLGGSYINEVDTKFYNSWIRARVHGTSVFVDYSHDGISWMERINFTADFTPAQVGLGFRNSNDWDQILLWDFFRMHSGYNVDQIAEGNTTLE